MWGHAGSLEWSKVWKGRKPWYTHLTHFVLCLICGLVYQHGTGSTWNSLKSFLLHWHYQVIRYTHLEACFTPHMESTWLNLLHTFDLYNVLPAQTFSLRPKDAQYGWDLLTVQAPAAVKTHCHFREILPRQSHQVLPHLPDGAFLSTGFQNWCLLSKKNRPPPTWRHLSNPAVCHVPFEPLAWGRHDGKHSLQHHPTTPARHTIIHSEELFAFFYIYNLTDPWLASVPMIDGIEWACAPAQRTQPILLLWLLGMGDGGNRLRSRDLPRIEWMIFCCTIWQPSNQHLLCQKVWLCFKALWCLDHIPIPPLDALPKESWRLDEFQFWWSHGH